VTRRLSVLVAGATDDDRPPGIGSVAEVADLTFSDTPEGVADVIGAADVVFAWRAHRELLEPGWPRASRLRWIQTASAGVDALLFPGLVGSGVVVTNARGVFDAAIAEWVTGMFVVFAKNVLGVLERQRRREWRHELTEPLRGRRVLVVGVGGIGRAIGRNAATLEMDVRGVGRTTRPGDQVFDVVLGIDELHGALGWADYVVDVLPGTPATHHMFDARAFAAMKVGARFVNVGRGSTVDETALVDALRDGRLSGAALDVFEREPLPTESPLWNAPGVVVFPHMSGDFAGWRESVVELFLENLVRFAKGEPLRNVVDKSLGYSAGS
jgi:phosphoglycerate dehydrogenase-like enzyme